MFRKNKITVVKSCIKLTLLILVFVGSLFIPKSHIEASSADSVQNELTAVYEIKEDLTASVKFIHEITNSSQTSLVDKYSISIPYIDAENIVVYKGGLPVTVQRNNYPDRIDLKVDLLNDPLKINEKITFETRFSTAKVADDFFGIKRVLVSGTDNSLKVKELLISVPDSFGTIDIEKTGIYYKFVTNSAVYLTFNTEGLIGFKIDQTLNNKSSEQNKVRFLLPRESFNQSVYYYPFEHGVDLVADDIRNNFAEIMVEPNSEREVGISGIIKINPFPLGNFGSIEETKFWEIHSSEVKDVSVNFADSPTKAYDILNYVLQNYTPTLNPDFERVKVSEYIKSPNLSEIQYADLLVTLLRSNNIPSNISIGQNFGYTRMGKDYNYNAWVNYFDAVSGKWEVMDPFFIETENIFPLAASDRIEYFLIDGREDPDYYEYFFSQDNANYLVFDKVLSSEIVNDNLSYEINNLTDYQKPLNVPFPLELYLVNSSSRPISLLKVINNSDLNIHSESGSVWILPGQKKYFKASSLIVGGFGIKHTENFDIDIIIGDLRGGEKVGPLKIEIEGIPTLQSYLPFVASALILSSIFFVLWKYRAKFPILINKVKSLIDSRILIKDNRKSK